MNPLERWTLFAGAVRARLDRGAVEYGDRSFALAPEALLDELQAEAADIAGWGFILWCRLEAMREALEGGEHANAHTSDMGRSWLAK
jgi:hypothetical protein